ncbi:MAG: hypothetical protein ACP5II_08090 [Infirmifilum sp.]|uniref:hypothetical protein n=1 Tax=Infirmifilum sp. TaxID=2856575 RepID=UPI003D09F3EB
MQDLGVLEVNADINACLNITHKTRYSPPTPNEVKAFVSTHSGVIPLNEKKRKIHQEQYTNP